MDFVRRHVPNGRESRTVRHNRTERFGGAVGNTLQSDLLDILITLYQIPFVKSVEKHYDAVACFSPLFYSDRWQLLIALIEIYRQFGMSLQVFYVQSLLTAIMDFMRVGT